MQLPFLTPAYTPTDIFFNNFLELSSTISEKYFCHKFPLLTDSPQPPHISLNAKGLLRVANVFC